MTSFITLVIIAMIGGIVVVLQAQMIGLMEQKMGALESVFMTYGSGGLLISLILLAMRGGNLKEWVNVPWYAFLAGVVGLIIIGTISYTVPRLGLVTAFTILVATQFIGGALIDHWGLMGAEVRLLDLPKLIGIGVVLVGIWLIIR
jgi:bacterial/archaeal transporter family-2 protein